MTFVFASAWGLCVLAGLVGWGRLLGRFLRPGPVLSLGLAGALGFSFSVFFGGVLGLFHLILPAVVIGFIAAGFLVLVIFPGEPGRPRPGLRDFLIPGRGRPGSRVLLLAVVVFPTLRYFASVHSTDFQYQDDTPGYVVFPVKMLQTGEFAPDPFSDRRMAGLGGQQWSQSLVLALFDPTSINLFDHGIALLLLIAVAAAWLNKIGADRRLALMVLLVLALFYPDFLNCCSFITQSLLILAIFVLSLDDIDGPREAVLLAIMVSALCSLKGTAVLFTGAILGACFLFKAVESRSIRPLIFAAATAMLTLIFLFPWMWAMHKSSGTFMYPLLGRGYSTLPNLSGHMHHQAEVIMLSLVTAGSGLLVLFCLRNSTSHRRWSQAGALFLLACAPVTYVVAWNTGGLSWIRYSQPFMYGLIPLPLVAVWFWSQAGGPVQRRVGLIGFYSLATCIVVSCTGWVKKISPIVPVQRDLLSLPAGFAWTAYPKVSPLQFHQAKALQDSVPVGAPILARLDFPHLMNFKRNPVYIDDHPGLALPPPGLPQNPEPQSLRRFLVDHGVRYIAYSYGDEANFPAALNDHHNYENYWDDLVAHYTLGTQDAFMKLSRTHRIIYDDRANMVIDLDTQVTDEHR